MWACRAPPTPAPTAQLPEGSSAIQTMESPLLSLESVLATWLSPSSTLWVLEVIVGILCGLGLFLLSLPFWPRDPSSPPPRKPGNLRKVLLEPRQRNRRRNRGAAPRGFRGRLKLLDVTNRLISRLESHLSGIPDKGGSHRVCQDPAGEVCKPQTTGAHQPCREPVDNVSPAMSPSASQTPLLKQPLPLASTVSPDTLGSTCSVRPHSSQSASQPPELFLPLDSPSPQPLASSPPPPCPSDVESRPPSLTASAAPSPPDSTLALPQCDPMTLPLGAVPRSSSPHTPCAASPAPAISSLGHQCHKCLQCPPEEKQRPPESSFGRRLRLFFQGMFPHEETKHQDALPESKLSPATTQSQGSFTSRSITENMDPEAQALMRSVGQILEKVAVLRGLHTTSEQDFQAPVRGCYHSHGRPGHPGPGKMSHTPGGHQATQQGQGCSVKEHQVRHQESLKSGGFNNKQLDLRNSASLSHKTLSSLVSRCQQGRAVPRIAGQ